MGQEKRRAWEKTGREREAEQKKEIQTDRWRGEWFHTNKGEKSPQDGIVLHGGDV